MVDYDEAIYLWKVHKFDFGNWMLAFIGTLFLGVELGLGIAVGISLLLVVFESAYPHTAVLGRLPGTTEYRNVKVREHDFQCRYSLSFGQLLNMVLFYLTRNTELSTS